MSDIEKPVEEAPAVAGAGASNGAAAGQTTTKSPTFLDKLSMFTVGKNRGRLPSEKGTWLQSYLFLGVFSVSARAVDDSNRRNKSLRALKKKGSPTD